MSFFKDLFGGGRPSARRLLEGDFWETARAEDISWLDRESASGRDTNGMTPLHFAAGRASDVTMLLRLVQAGAELNAVNKDGLAPLHIAVLAGRPVFVAALLSAGADVTIASTRGQTPLHAAGMKCADAKIILGLVSAGADVQAVNTSGHTALYLAAGSNPNPQVVGALLSAGAKVNHGTDGGMTALHQAAWNNPNPEISALLLRRGASVNALNAEGYTPLHYAASFNPNPLVADALLAAGADRAKKTPHGKVAFELAEGNRAIVGTDTHTRLLPKGARN